MAIDFSKGWINEDGAIRRDQGFYSPPGSQAIPQSNPQYNIGNMLARLLLPQKGKRFMNMFSKEGRHENRMDRMAKNVIGGKGNILDIISKLDPYTEEELTPQNQPSASEFTKMMDERFRKRDQSLEDGKVRIDTSQNPLGLVLDNDKNLENINNVGFQDLITGQNAVDKNQENLMPGAIWDTTYKKPTDDSILGDDYTQELDEEDYEKITWDEPFIGPPLPPVKAQPNPVVDAFQRYFEEGAASDTPYAEDVGDQMRFEADDMRAMEEIKNQELQDFVNNPFNRNNPMYQNLLSNQGESPAESSLDKAVHSFMGNKGGDPLYDVTKEIQDQNNQSAIDEWMTANPQGAIPYASNITDEELRVAQTALGEGRGEGSEGMQGILETMLNRVGVKGDSLLDVVNKPWQYSVNAPSEIDSANTKYVNSLTRNDANVRKVVDMLRGLQGGSINRILPEDTMHYFNPNLVAPNWASDAQADSIYNIGNHRFIRGVR